MCENIQTIFYEGEDKIYRNQNEMRYKKSIHLRKRSTTTHKHEHFFLNVSIYFFNPGIYSSFLSVSKIRARKRNFCGDHSQDERKIIFMLVGWNRMVGVRPLQQLKGTYKLYIDWIH